MTPEQKVFELLSADTALVALVPAARIKPPGDIQGLEKPYIIHFPVAVEPTNCHDGPQTFRTWRFYQVSVYSADYTSGRAVATAVEAALDGYSDGDVDRLMLVGPPKFINYDTDLKLAHFALDFEIAGALS